MSNNIVKYAFIAGEVSPTLYGRTDLTAYDLGVAEAYNFFVDYRGGLSSRPGTEFCEFVKADDKATRFYDFAFSPDLSETYVLLFGDYYVRFIQDGAYVLEEPLNITAITKASPAVVTSAGHGLENGQWVYLGDVEGMTEINGRYYEVAGKTTNTFQLLELPHGTALDSTAFSAYTSGGTIEAVYEVTTPYPAEALSGLGCDQYRDTVRLTHVDYPVHNLIRNDHDDWVIEEEEISASIEGPTITSGSGSAAGDAQVLFTVTKVLRDGTESLQGNLYEIDNIINYTVEEGSVTIGWVAASDAVSYNVYRSVVASNGNLDAGAQMGFVGNVRGTSFVDPNIVPDFARQPPINYNPFAPGSIEYIEVTGGGSGYGVFGTSVSITDPDGSGFIGRAIVSSAGAIVGVKVLSGGEGYTSPSVVFTGAGTSAAGDAETSPILGTYPALAAIYQQRQVYAASTLDPVTVWGSRIKRFSDFTVTDLALDDEAYEVSLDTKSIAPIRHMLVTRGGLLCMTQENVWLLNGGSASSPITPTDALAEPQTYTGVSPLRPIQIASDILFVEGKGFAVRLLAYNEISKVYSGDDRSILSNHLFGPGKDIISWAYQEDPFKVVWCVRADGALLAFTIVKSEEVYAWTQAATKGKYLDVISVRENTSDRVYLMTRRYVNGRWTKFVERMTLQQFDNVEDAWCVDCGLELGHYYPTEEIYITKEGDDWFAKGLTTEAYTAAGKFLRGGGGVFKVLEDMGAGTVKLELWALPSNFIPETGDLIITFPMAEGEWTLDSPVTILRGLWHLEGETVSVLGDGNVFPPQVVVNGQITLPNAVTTVRVGLGYTCRARTLPLIVPDAGIEARRKRVVGLGIRLSKSRGLKIGRALEKLYEMRERTTEPWGHPTAMVNGTRYQMISTNWDEDGQTYFLQENPLPVTLLSIVQDIEVGDDPD